MNTQIKRLLEQSGLQPYYNGQEVDIAKFAELLIRECMNICAEREEDIRTRIKDERQAATAYMCRAYIKEHFGVEE